MSRKAFLAILFAVMLVLGTVPVEAWAQALEVRLYVDFNGQDEYDVNPMIKFYDGDWQQIGATKEIYLGTTYREYYRYFSEGAPEGTENYQIFWDHGDIENWDPDPISGELDIGQTSIIINLNGW